MIKVQVNYANSLLASIFYLVVGVVLFTVSEDIVAITFKVLGGVIIAIGLVKTLIYSYNKGKNPEYPVGGMIWAFTLILFGLVFIFFANVIEQFIRFLIGGFILIAGINRLIRATEIQNKSTSKFLSILISAAIFIALGFFVIFYSGLILKGLGIVIIAYAILEIINYIMVVRNNDEDIIVKEKKKQISEVQIIEAEAVVEEKHKKDKKK